MNAVEKSSAVSTSPQIDDRVGGVTVRSAHGDSRDGDSVVISSGARLNKLAAPFGVRKLVQAGRGYSFSVKPEHLPKNPVYFPTQRVACTPLHTIAFRVAGMMEFRSPDAPLDPRRVQAIIDAAKPMLSGIDWTAREEEWVGSRPCTTDGLPLIGATKSPRVHVAGGHGMWGIALGPLTGKMVADSMTGAQTPDRQCATSIRCADSRFHPLVVRARQAEPAIRHRRAKQLGYRR